MLTKSCEKMMRELDEMIENVKNPEMHPSVLEEVTEDELVDQELDKTS